MSKYTIDELRPIGSRGFITEKSKIAEGKTVNGKPYFPTTGYEFFNTKAGRFKLSDWINLIEEAIKDEGEETLYEKIVIYSKENFAWLKKSEELRVHAAECLLNKAYTHWEGFNL